jgi:two-component system nitrogen regulation response regulator GlnG/two-component system response regulator HydG
MRIDGVTTEAGSVGAGHVLALEDQIVLACVARPQAMPEGNADTSFEFGGPDAHGLVGESAAVWTLREEIAFVARHAKHVLLLGDSGAGKELVARAIHAESSRANRPLVARNAATLPPTLADAELFGHARNYPNAGMPERLGLLGEAEGGTLFLDEAGELPSDLQAHLLRVLDSSGEYHRLGESAMRRADVRLIAATNRPEASLKHDFAARFLLKLRVPGIAERREDVPLLARHLLRRAAMADPTLGQRFFGGWGGPAPEPRIDPRLIELFLVHDFLHNVRELEALLWTAMAKSRDGYIALVSDVEERLAVTRPPAAMAAELTKERIIEALDAHEGNQERAFRALGLRSRDALYRLIKKHGIEIRRSRR